MLKLTRLPYDGVFQSYSNNAYISSKTDTRDFPGGPVVKNPPYNAGDVGSIPGQGIKIPHAAGQLSSRAATTEHSSHN